jgi:sorting nexin-3/12
MTSPNLSTQAKPLPRGFAETSRLQVREQTIDEIYGVPENFLEIEVKNPQTHGINIILYSQLTLLITEFLLNRLR